MPCLPHCTLCVAVQNKHYPRDWMIPGRLRVKLLNEDGTPANPDVPTRELRDGVIVLLRTSTIFQQQWAKSNVGASDPHGAPP